MREIEGLVCVGSFHGQYGQLEVLYGKNESNEEQTFNNLRSNGIMHSTQLKKRGKQKKIFLAK